MDSTLNSDKEIRSPSFEVSRFSLVSVPLGTFMQWYDFSIFGALAVTLSSVFFPHRLHETRLLNTFLVFSVSFILAPLGALLLGWIGDKYGRKKALTVTIVLMAIPTLVIAILPGYAELGILSTMLLVVCRLLQGVSSGAEFTSSAVYLVESSTARNRNFMGCLTSVSYSLGSLAGSFVVAILTMPIFPDGFWRIAFALSAVGAVTAFYIRKRLPESKIFSEQSLETVPVHPLRLAISQDGRAMLMTFLLASASGILTYGTFVWMIAFLNLILKFSVSLCVSIAMVSMATDAVVEPIWARLIDIFEIPGSVASGIGMVALALLAFPLFGSLSGASVEWAFGFALVMGLLIAIICAPLNTLMTLSYRPENRCSGFGVSFNLGISIWGGTTPLVLTYLLTRWGLSWVAFYYVLACFVGLLAIFLGRGR